MFYVRLSSVFIFVFKLKRSFCYSSTNINRDKFYIKELEKNNRSIFSKVSLKPEEVLLKVPSSEIISLKNEKVLEFCKARNLNLNNELECLTAYLLYEYNYQNSELKFYFESIPADFSNFPIFYKTDLRNLLQTSFFLKNLKKIEDEINDLKNSPELESYKSDEILKMYIVLMSRAFGIDMEDKTYYALVPIGDMFNTSIGEKNVNWYFDQNFNLIVESKRCIEKDEEIIINYNEGYNSHFLLYYGFTVPNNNNIADIEDFEIPINDNKILIKLTSPPSVYRYNLNEIRKLKNLLENKDSDIICLKLIKERIIETMRSYPTTLKVKII
jgi:hypothetical protein